MNEFVTAGGDVPPVQGMSRYGFSAAEISADQITAFVETWKEPNQKAGGFSEPMGTYGITWAGGGHEDILWGGGFARNPEPLIAEGLVRLLIWFPSSTAIHAHVHKELWKHVAPGDGYVRHNSSKNYHGFKPLSEVARALDGERLLLTRQEKIGRPTSQTPRGAAHSLATGMARGNITEYRRRNPRAIPSLGIVVEG